MTSRRQAQGQGRRCQGQVDDAIDDVKDKATGNDRTFPEGQRCQGRRHGPAALSRRLLGDVEVVADAADVEQAGDDRRGRTSVNDPPLASNRWCASISARSPLESTKSTPLRSISSVERRRLRHRFGDLRRRVRVDLADDGESVRGRRDGERCVRHGHELTVSIAAASRSLADADRRPNGGGRRA